MSVIPFDEVLLICLLSFVTSVISGATGSGGGELFLAGLPLPLKTAIPIHGVVQLFNNFHRIYLLKKYLKKEIYLPFLLGSLPGLFLVTFVIKEMNNKTLPYFLIIAVLVYTLIRPKKLPAIKLYKKGFFSLGLATGFLGVLIGTVGPLISPFFLRDDLNSHEVVANKSFFQTWIHLTKLPVFIYLGFPYLSYAWVLVLFILSGMLGTVVGIRLLAKFSKKTFDNIFKIFLFLVTIRMSYSLYLLL